MLYEVAILENPTKKEAEEGKSEKIILHPKSVVANNDKTAAIIASKDTILDDVDPNRLVILVRPFVQS